MLQVTISALAGLAQAAAASNAQCLLRSHVATPVYGTESSSKLMLAASIRQP